MESRSLLALLLGISIALGFAAKAHAYAPLGHEIVGAVADERLANTPTAAKIRALIGNLSLEKAALLADTIKGWDRKGVDNPKSFRVASPTMDRQLRIFGEQINRCTTCIQQRRHIIVFITPMCQSCRRKTTATARLAVANGTSCNIIPDRVDVLRGRRPEQNERNITKPVALILLAHYVADIHQPLHVGAQYFDAQGRAADPEKDRSALGDEGGNTFTLELSDEPPRTRGVRKKHFHAFWDYDAVNAIFPQMPTRVRKRELQTQITPLKRQLVRDLATHEPTSWRMPTNMDVRVMRRRGRTKFCRSRVRHTSDFNLRMCIRNARRIVSSRQGKRTKNLSRTRLVTAHGRQTSSGEELHKAGWRLADLLEKTL